MELLRRADTPEDHLDYFVAKGLGSRLGGGRTPWEQLDQAADNAADVHGGPQPGVDPVPNAPDAGAGSPSGGADFSAAPASGAGDAPHGGDGGAADAADQPKAARQARN